MKVLLKLGKIFELNLKGSDLDPLIEQLRNDLGDETDIPTLKESLTDPNLLHDAFRELLEDNIENLIDFSELDANDFEIEVVDPTGITLKMFKEDI